MSIQEIIDALWEKVLEDLTGIISIWSGAIVDIPEGWHLCDGNAGTVDLRDQFVVGAGFTYDPDESGGSVNHDHLVTSSPHNHILSPGAKIGTGTTYDEDTSYVQVTGDTDSRSHLPPYYSLAFIQKI